MSFNMEQEFAVNLYESVAKQVIGCTFDRTLWDHKAHLAFAAGVHRMYGPSHAMAISRQAIRRYNDSTNCANTDTSGYHETLTAYYCAAVSHVIKTSGIDSVLEDHPLLTRVAPLRYWDREELFSIKARQGWIEPKVPFPFDAPAEPITHTHGSP